MWDQFGEFMYFFSMALFLVYAPCVLLFVLIMHFLMPKAVLEKYFKPPYFREAECIFFSGIPYAPIRTVMFIRVIASPTSGKVRGITEAHLLVPKWYGLASRVMLIMIYIMGALMAVFFVGGSIVYFVDQN